jgi:hypothetical protein
MDFHAHLDRDEVIGLLAGRWRGRQGGVTASTRTQGRKRGGGGGGGGGRLVTGTRC